MVIICILATGVVYMYSNPTAKVKGVMFNILADLNLARSESVNRNQDILVDFTLGDRDGYLICLDTDSDKDCDDELAENIIKKVLFREEVQFYDCGFAPPYPANGPTKTPSGTNHPEQIWPGKTVSYSAARTILNGSRMEPAAITVQLLSIIQLSITLSR
jgi:hypothetical protein